MSYVIAAYGVTLITLAAYGFHLARERARLRRLRDDVPKTERG